MAHWENAVAGPSRPRKPAHPFVSSDNRPDKPDGIFRVVIISSGSVASIKIPEIVGALSKDRNVAVQVVATKSSSHFYTQQQVDEAVRAALEPPIGNVGQHGSMEIDAEGVFGVKVWTDADEWSDWKKVADPILHIELRRWADLVVVAPCSADMLAKIAGGLCDNLATSLLRALSPSTPTILCPAMNTHMYQHPLTADHLQVAQEKLGYLISGPQGAGRLACGDEGAGKMTDWRDIVSMVLDFAAAFRQRSTCIEPERPLQGSTGGRAVFYPTSQKSEGWAVAKEAYIGTGTVQPNSRPNAMVVEGSSLMPDSVLAAKASSSPSEQQDRPKTPPTPGMDPAHKKKLPKTGNVSVEHWHMLIGNGAGGDGSAWNKKWWMG